MKKLMGLRAATYVASFAGVVLVLAALVGVYALLHQENKPATQVADLSLVNSASPSISPLIYGTNLAMDNSQDQFLSNAGAAPALQGLHVQLVRMPIRDQLTPADYTTALTKIKQIGATPLLIVHGAAYNNGSDPYPVSSALLQIAKNIFPTQTVYVDVGNEEDLAGVNVQTYVSSKYGWNTEVPRYKQLTGSNFKYGGPVNYQYDQAYIDTFVATANPSPDYVVWHAYAGSCGHNTGTGQPDSQAHFLTSVDNWGSHIQQISNDFATQNGGAHKGMPIIIDEWNYASDLGVGGSASPCYSNDQTFINTFFNKALNMFIASGQYGVIGTAEYEAFRGGADENMLDGSNAPTFQGQVFKTSYETNIGKTPPPPPPPSYACSGLNAAVDPSNPMAYNFTATAQVANGAVLNNGDFTFGDGSSLNGVAPSGLNITANHPYTAQGTYNAVATLHFTVSGTSVTATCSTQVVVSSGGSGNPSYSGTLQATQDQSNAMLFNFVGQTATGGGAAFKNADIAFGDGKSATGLTPSSGGSSVQTSHPYAANGTYTAKATFSFLVQGVTKTTTATTQVVVNGSSGGGGGGGQQQANDTFSRPNQSGWGTASDGQNWGADSSGGPFSIKNNVGIIANTSTSSAGILGPVMENSQVVFTGRISQFHYSNFGAVIRYKDTNNWYKAYLDGGNIVVQKRVNGSYTILKQVGFRANADTNYTVRFQAVGNTLSVKAWPASSSEPSGWNLTTTDSTFTSGYDGLRALPQGGIVVGYYYFKAYKL